MEASQNNTAASFLHKGSFQWKRSDSDVWLEIEQLIDNKPVVRRRNYAKQLVSIAAVALVLTALSLFATLYTKTVETQKDEHLTVELPDGSFAKLNAVSSIKYYPCRWFLNREVKLSGEAFFEGDHGKDFSVVSNIGKTTVLGTSFNVFARENTYRVTCITGKVCVSSNADKSVILTSNTKAEIDGVGNIIMSEVKEISEEPSWCSYSFFFTSASISEVLTEIERQYGIVINNKTVPTGLYTGNFKRESNVEDVLNMVCLSMGLDYRKISPKEYVVSDK